MSNAFKLVAREEGVIHLTAMWELEVDNNFSFNITETVTSGLNF